jgi:uncharacterized protein (DUF1501 family)
MNKCEARVTRLTRRHVLGTAGALFAWAYAPHFVQAAGGRDARLLVVVLRGALDGLAAVPPIADPDYEGLRGKIVLRADGDTPALPLDGFFFAHPAMPTLARLYREKQALIFHAAATNYRERSHFDGQDVLESGQPAPGHTESGWLNRLGAALPAGEAIGHANILGVGPVAPLIVRGPAPTLGWSPPSVPRANGDLADRLAAIYKQTDPMLADALSLARSADALATQGGLNGMKSGGLGSSAQAMEQIAQGAARIMADSGGPRLAAIALDGWDTHTNEGGAKGALAMRLAGLDAAFAAFETEMKPVWKDTAILVLTEFGRTARVNGAIGTDHGVGAAAFLLGGAVKGGRVIADWPGLKTEQLYEARDLKPTIDVRAVCKGVAQGLFGVSAQVLATRVFPDSIGIAPLAGLIA